jgi:hypothetical protein
LAQLAARILPPTALPIALPITLYAVTGGRVVEAAEIWYGRCRSVASAAELVGTPTSIETAPVTTKIAKGLALSNKDRRWGVGHGQQRSVYGSRSHELMGGFVNKFMREDMTVEICIR